MHGQTMNHSLLKRVISEKPEIIRKSKILDRDVSFERNGNYVIAGPRCAGKSTLLYKRAKDLIAEGKDWKQIIYINFDDERLFGFTIKDFDDVFETAEEISPLEHFYFFDEIQNIDGWERLAIRIANQGLKAYLAVSNEKMLSQEMVGKLGGRYFFKEILPYSFWEYLRAGLIREEIYTAKEKGKTLSALGDYFAFGGFPGGA